MILVDPASRFRLNQLPMTWPLARCRRVPTHPHWDHLPFPVPRPATPPRRAHAAVKPEAAQRWRRERSAPELIGLVTPLPADGDRAARSSSIRRTPRPRRVLLADRGVLLAGDMLSDVLIPPSPSPPIRWAPTRRHSTAGSPRHSMSCPRHAPLPRVPRCARLAADLPTSTRCGEERNRRRASGAGSDWLSGVDPRCAVGCACLPATIEAREPSSGPPGPLIQEEPAPT